MVWGKLGSERKEERKDERQRKLHRQRVEEGAQPTEPYRQGFERKREKEGDESSREEGGAYAYHTFLSLCSIPIAFPFFPPPCFPSFSFHPSRASLFPYPLFTTPSFALYASVTRYSCTSIFSFTLICASCTPWISRVPVRLISYSFLRWDASFLCFSSNSLTHWHTDFVIYTMYIEWRMMIYYEIERHGNFMKWIHT